MTYPGRFAAVLSLAALLLAVHFSTGTVAGKPPGGGGGTVTRRYSFELVGLPGEASSKAYGINVHGDVVGYSNIPGLSDRAFVSLLSDGVRTNIDLNSVLHPDDQARWLLRTAADINDSGWICGTGRLDGQWDQAFRLIPDGRFDPDTGEVWPLIEHIGPGYPRSINNVGDVVGQADSQAFLYTDETGPVDLGRLRPDDNATGAFSVNDNLQISGYSGVSPGSFEAFRFHPASGMTGLGYLKVWGGFYSSFGWDINNQGMIAGHSGAAGGAIHAVRWIPGSRIKDLGHLGGNYSIGCAIEPNGEVVGVSTLSDGQYRLFRYSDNLGMINIEPLITDLPPEYVGRLGIGDTSARVNASGDICGGTNGNSVHAFVLTVTSQ